MSKWSSDGGRTPNSWAAPTWPWVSIPKLGPLFSQVVLLSTLSQRLSLEPVRKRFSSM